jgi:transposase InsO family protein
MEMMKTHYPLSELSEAFGVSKSGWHAHGHKAQRPRAREDCELLAAIEPLFTESRKTYGSPRLTHALRQGGRRCSKNRVARLMRQRGLRARQKRRFRPCTTQSRHDNPVAPNWLAKVPAPDRPDQVWVADITYIETMEGWLYLAGIVDACSRRCIGWSTDASLHSDLVTRAWDQAWRKRRPGPGLLHHSDRGVQYASGAYRMRVRSCGAVGSMSRKAYCFDNAIMESFWATLKTEGIPEDYLPKTHCEARLMIFDYIETFYNTRRLHSSLGFVSPEQFEKNLISSTN